MENVYFGDDFGQKIDLTVRIREILRNYPEGTSVLKELIQNADDAGATEIAFCLDKRQHGTKKLAYSKLDRFQGPSLLAYNNAQFTDIDLQSIQRIGDSLKKDSSKGRKTGRFGIGFNSVYHLTDLPTFVSGQNIIMFDPQACYLPNVNPSNPGKLINFIAHQELVQQYPDQFSPFRCFGCDLKSAFNGTLFRLPLRTSEQASISKLTSRAQSVANIQILLKEFAAESQLILLFLRNIVKISIYEWNHDCIEPALLQTTHLKNFNYNLQQKRNQQAAQNDTKTIFSDTGEHFDYILEIESVDATNVPNSSKWIVCNQLGGSKCSEIANDPSNKTLQLVPWGGVAARIPEDNPSSSLKQRGQAFCFLPLPVETQLPVHVNGYFELSSNRRDIWSGDGLSGDGLLRAQWNEMLLTHVIASCYARCVAMLITYKFQDPQVYFHIFPLELPQQNVWKMLMLSTYVKLANVSCLYTSLKDGMFVTFANAIVLNPQYRYSKDLEDVLLQEQFPIVSMPNTLQQQLIAEGRTYLKLFTPSQLRQYYQRRQPLVSGDNVERTIKILLDFCMSDLVPETYSELIGVHLLPCADNSIQTFQSKYCVDAAALAHLCSMGYSQSHVTRALVESKSNLEIALSWLFENPNLALVVGDDFTPYTYYVANEEELKISLNATKHFINVKCLTPNVLEQFQSSRFQDILNITKMQVEVLEDLLSFILPADYYMKPEVIIGSGTNSHIPMEWFRRLWQYIGRSAKLNLFEEKWPIVPCVDGYICALSPTSKVISGCLLDPIVLNCLKALNVRILTLDLFQSFEPHPTLWQYIHQPTCSGVLNALSYGYSVDLFTATISGTFRQALREFLLIDSINELSQKQLQMLQSLPIFHGFTESATTTNDGELGHVLAWEPESGLEQCSNITLTPTYCALNASKIMYVTSNVAWYLLTPAFLYHGNDFNDLIKYRQLGLTIIDQIEFYTSHFFPRLHTFSIEIQLESISNVLLELPILLSHDRDDKLQRSLTHSALYLSMDLQLRPIYELYDPEVEEFEHIVDPSQFPCSKLQSIPILTALRSIGIQRTLNRRSLLHVAYTIEMKHEYIQTCQNEDLQKQFQARSTELLKYIDLHHDRLLSVSKKSTSHAATKKKKRKSIGYNFIKSFLNDSSPMHPGGGHRSAHEVHTTIDQNGQVTELAISEETQEIEDFKQKLVLIEWMPILVDPLHPCLPWPNQTESKKYVAAPITVRSMEKQWLCSYSYGILNGHIYSKPFLEMLNWENSIPLQIVAVQLKQLEIKYHEQSIRNSNEQLAMYSSVLPSLYQYMNASFQSVEAKEQSIVSELLNSFPWIFIGNLFFTPNQVAIRSSINLFPYLTVLPLEMHSFQSLFIQCGQIRQHFTTEDHVNVLQQIYIKYDRGTIVMSSTDLTIAIGVVQVLSDEGIVRSQQRSAATIDNSCESALYIPDVDGYLVDAKLLTCNDAPWMVDEHTLYANTMRFVHSKISMDVGTKLGVQSLRNNLLSQVQDNSLDFDLTSNHIQSFGQSESLTRRLSNILEQYPEGPSILNELIQNADDARASRFCVCFNFKTYGTSSLLNSSMAPWQGPALYCYNDAVFEDTDFSNLAKIGQGSKLGLISTTGRFGLGFNSVYHFTDVPSVVSGASLVMFDPHTRYVPNATPSQPGIKIQYVKSLLVDQFPDQFKPYILFGCDMKTKFNGTLFRFPLRTLELASKSEIKRQHFTNDDIGEMLTSFRSTIASTLLFLRYVRQVEVFVLTDTDDYPQLLYRSEVPVSERTDVLKTINTIVTSKSNEQVQNSPELKSKAEFYNSLAKLPPAALPHISQSLHIDTFEQKLCSTILKAISTSKVESTMFNNTKFTSHGEEYLIYHHLGGGKAREMACDMKNRELKLIPFAGIAAKCGQTLHDDGKIYCFLPLPVKSNLPVHVNGYFELSSNRRDIWYGDDMAGEGRQRSDWNSNLLMDCAAPAYVSLLLGTKPEPFEDASYEYYLSLFPTSLPSVPLLSIVLSVYSMLSSLPVLYSSIHSGSYVKPIDSILLNPELSLNAELKSILSQGNISPVTIENRALRQVLVETNAVWGELSPSSMRQLIRNGKVDVSALDVLLIKPLIEYVMEDIKTEDDLAQLHMLPLIYTRGRTLDLLYIEHDSCRILDPLATTCTSRNGVKYYYCQTDKEVQLLQHKLSHLAVDTEICEALLQFKPLLKHSNVVKFKVMDIFQHLHNFMPSHWHRQPSDHQKLIVEWEPTEITNTNNHPSIEWVSLLWSCFSESIDKLKSLSSRALEAFTEWPLVPISDTAANTAHLYYLSFNHKLFVNDLLNLPRSSHSVRCELLFPLQIYALNVSSFATSEACSWLVRNELATILSPLSVLNHYQSKFQTEANGLLSVLRNAPVESRLELCAYLCSIDIKLLLLAQADLYHSLPLFPVYCKATTEHVKFVPMSKDIVIAPENLHSDLYQDSFLYLTGNATNSTTTITTTTNNSNTTKIVRDFLRLNGAQEYNMTDLLITFIFQLEHFAQLSEETQFSTIIDMVQSLHSHQRQNHKFKDYLKSVPVFYSRRMELRRITDLHDPIVQELSEFLDCNSFPHEKYDSCMDLLRSLGLRNTLTCHGIVECARSIHSSVQSSGVNDSGVDDRVYNKSMSLLHLVNKNFDELYHKQAEEVESENLEAILHDLQQLNWLPVQSEPKSVFLSWKCLQNQKIVTNATELRMMEHAWQVSSIKYILNGSLHSKVLESHFQWSDSVSCVDIALQIKNISDHFQNIPIQVKSAVELKHFGHEMELLFELLLPCIETPDLLNQIVVILSKEKWVWTGTTFLNSWQIAFSCEFKLTPLLYSAPVESIVPHALLRAFHVKEVFEITDYVAALYELHHHRALTAAELNLVLSLLEIIVNISSQHGDSDDAVSTNTTSSVTTDNDLINLKIVLPDSQNVLCDAELLVYDDIEWIESNDIRKNRHFVLNQVPKRTALLCGATSLHALTSDTSLSSVEFACPPRHLIEYVRTLPMDSASVVKVMSDLLGFGEYKQCPQMDFILDSRRHPTVKILRPSLQALQSDALCIHYSSLVFKLEDIYDCFYALQKSYANIWSSLYFGDCIQILSGEYLYIIDPLGIYLSDANCEYDQLPTYGNGKGLARRYNILSPDFLQYSDQLKPFEILPNCPGNISNGVNGTIIRISFRSNHKLRTSAFSSFVWTSDCEKTLIDSFLATGPSSLLFTQYVGHISLWQINATSFKNHGTTPASNATTAVGSRSTSTSSSKKEITITGVECLMDVMVQNAFGVLQQRRQYISNTEWKLDTKKIKNQLFNFFNKFTSTVNTIPVMYTECVIHCQLKSLKYVDRWCICASLGAGPSSTEANSSVFQQYDVVPYAAVACHYARNDAIVVDTKLHGRVFNTFETLTKSNLPVHINGCFLLRLEHCTVPISVGNNSVEVSTEMKWNSIVVQECVAESYIELLIEMRKKCETNNMKALYSFWPSQVNEEESEAIGKCIQKNLYARIESHELFLCTDGVYRKFSDCYVVDCADMKVQVASFAKLHFPSLNIPSIVVTDCNHFFSNTAKTLSPHTMRMFLKHIPTHTITYEMALPLLEYCLQDLNELLILNHSQLCYQFDGIPLLPLADLSVGKIHHHNGAQKYIVGTYNQYSLIPQMKSQCIALEATAKLCGYFNEIRLLNAMNVTWFSNEILAHHLESNFPSAWKSKRYIEWSSNEHLVSKLWLYRFWQQVNNDRHALEMFQSWPLLPVKSNRLYAWKYIYNTICLYKLQENVTLRQELVEMDARDYQEHQTYLNNLESKKLEMDQLAKQVTNSTISSTATIGDDTTSSQETGVIDASVITANSEDNFQEQVQSSPPLPSPTSTKNDFQTEEVIDATVNNNGTSQSTLEAVSESSDDEPPLEPVLDTETTLSVVSYTSVDDSVLYEILVKLNAPIMELAYFQKPEILLVSNTEVTSSVLTSFETELEDRTNFNQLTSQDRDNLVTFFSQFGQTQQGYSSTNINQLKQIPMFRTITNEYTSILSNRYYILDNSIDRQLFPIPNETQQYFLLCPSADCMPFYKELGVEVMDECKLLMEFILIRLNEMNASERTIILQSVQRQWRGNYQRNFSLINILKNTALFESDNGICVTADQLYDPQNLVLKSIFEIKVGCFPAASLCTEEWIEIMKKLGLQNEINQETYLNLAHEIATLYAIRSSGINHPIDPKLETRAIVLHNYFRDHLDRYKDSTTFCSELSKIHFVPATEYVRADDFKITPRSVLTNFVRCALPEDANLVFTTLPVMLPSVVPPLLLHRVLGIVSKPKLNFILEHLFHLVSSDMTLTSWQHTSNITAVFQSLFLYLETNYREFSVEVQAKLQSVAIIPVGTQFVKASRLYLRLVDNLAPFMYEIPRAFGNYDNLFQMLGTSELPTIDHYLHLLHELHSEYKDRMLNINEIRAVLSIVHIVSALLRKNPLIAINNRMYVPNTQCVLVRLENCLYNDSPWMCQQISLEELSIVHCKVSNESSRVLKMTRLTQVVNEVLDPSMLMTNSSSLPTGDYIAMDDKLTRLIQSKEFANGIRQVLTCQLLQKYQEFECTQEEYLAEINDKIDKLRFYTVKCVATLYTRFVLHQVIDISKHLQDNDNNDQTNRTQNASIAFIDRLHSTFYIAMENLPPNITIYQELARLINQLLENCIEDTTSITCMLQCDISDSTHGTSSNNSSGSMTSITTTLQSLRICGDDNIVDEFGRGVPGEAISALDIQLLELKPLRMYANGEIVAISNDNVQYKYATVEKELIVEGAKVVELVLNQVGGVRFIPASQVYGFKSYRSLPTNGVPNVVMSTPPKSVPLSGLIGTGFSRKTVDEAASTVTENEEVKPLVPTGHSFNAASLPVSEAQMIGAVNDILSRLNLSLSSPYTEMIASNIQLKQQLHELEQRINASSESVTQMQLERKYLLEALICAICFEREVDRVLIPCGHIYCQTCIERLPRSKCPICRERFTSSNVFHKP